jgi:hypothetical protein
VALGSYVLEESHIERREHQNNADIHHQPFPESVPKEKYVHGNDNGYQRGKIKHNRHVLRHLSTWVAKFNLLPTANMTPWSTWGGKREARMSALL